MNANSEIAPLTLESQWRNYRDAVYPAKNGPLPKLQETETRQAFFAGCLIVLKFATETATAMPEEQAIGFISSLIHEAQNVCSERIVEMKGRN